LEKTIEIKRRAQRCIQNGDLDGALSEYEKLVATADTDPYNLVLLADLLFKKGDGSAAGQRYLTAIESYQKAGLYKNAIAVCKKMMRLSITPSLVLKHLAELHALDGLGTEAVLYYQQYAEYLVREDKPAEAVEALRKGFEASPDSIKVLERLAEAHELNNDRKSAASALAEASVHYRRAGMLEDADRCQGKAESLQPGAMKSVNAGTAAPTAEPKPRTLPAREPGMVLDDDRPSRSSGPPRLPEATRRAAEPEPPENDGTPGLESPPRLADTPPALETVESSWEQSLADPSIVSETSGGMPMLEVESPPAMPEPPAPAAPPALPSGLRFDAPALAESDTVDQEIEAQETELPEPEAAPSANDSSAPLGDVEKLLAEAQEQFRSGAREAAAELLVRAAKAYESHDQPDHAASIYRSLCRNPQTPDSVLELWLSNCEQRADGREAAEVACELGDRALQDNRFDDARGWFERAHHLDESNPQAARRLARLSEISGAMAANVRGAATAAPEPAPPPVAPAPAPESVNGEEGRVEVAVGRGEAVTFDLGSLLSEFQRGVQAQLSGDAQSQYDLAMTYREMGLLEQAVESFRVAGREPAFAHRCAEMIGRCLLDQGRFEEAASELGAVLQDPDLAPEMAIDVRYQLGLALEAAGHAREALAEFERVFAAQANFSDVALKIRVLRKTLEHA